MLKSILNKNRVQYLVVMTSNAITIIVGFLLNIIATRILISKEYGFYRAFLTSLNLIGSLLNFGIHYTFSRQYALEKDELKSKGLNLVGLIIFGFISLIFLFVYIFITYSALYVFDIKFNPYFTYAVSATLIILLQYFLQQKYQGQNRMFRYSILVALPQLIILLTLIIVYYFKIKLDGISLVYIFILSNLFINLFFIFTEGFDTKTFKFNLLTVLNNNKKHGFQLYLGSLFNVTIAQILNLIIANLSGLVEFGYFSLGLSLAAPIAIIPTTFAIVKYDKNVLRSKINRNEIIFTMFFTLFCTFIYLIILNFVFPIVIGREYLSAIKYANILIYYFVLMGIGDYFNKFLNSKGMGIEIRNCSILSGVVLLISSLIFIPLFSVNGLIISKLLSSISYGFLMAFLYFKFEKGTRI